ncbi:MAG: hypothetical protein HY809_01375 [Nitrospirae bacterium]|nr:hypothetical protein [Nitrospirota bacterium]
MIKKKVAALLIPFLLIVVLYGCASIPPLPETINIVPPSPDVPPKLAALSGGWKGNFNSLVNVTVIVEKINVNEAEIIYSWGDAPHLNAGYVYAKSQVLNGDSIQYTDAEGGVLTLVMEQEPDNVTGYRDNPYFRKCFI